MYVLGYDIGSSSVKASLVNVESGKMCCICLFPENRGSDSRCQTGMG